MRTSACSSLRLQTDEMTPRRGLRHSSEARAVLSSDVDVLKYESLLQLKAKNWSGAQTTFQKLDAAKGPEVRHYKVEGADGRGDSLRGLGRTFYFENA